MNDDDESFAHLLEDPAVILEDLAESEERLHSEESVAPVAPAFTLGIRRRTPVRPAVPPPVTLASRIKEHRSLMQEFAVASGKKRTELLVTARPRLRSIIFAGYRPAPAYRSGHVLLPSVLQQKVMPGQPASWASTIAPAAHGQWARQTLRLDNSGGNHCGSGTLFPDGRILTAAHVVRFPGCIFGDPPSPQIGARAKLNRVVGGMDTDLTLQGFTPPGALDFAWLNASAEWPAQLAGTEFDALTGLALQSNAPEYKLAGRPVAVIGHPAAPAPGSSDAVFAPEVFHDAPYGLKRFMPGILHPKNPLVTRNGLSYLRHDCSTLGGASGSALIDLATGIVLGVHVSGKSPDGSEDHNLAVPAWMFTSAPPPLT